MQPHIYSIKFFFEKCALMANSSILKGEESAPLFTQL